MLRKSTEGEGHQMKVSGTRVSIITSADVELRICKATLSGFSRLPPSGLSPPPPGVLEDAVAGVRYAVSAVVYTNVGLRYVYEYVSTTTPYSPSYISAPSKISGRDNVHLS